MPLISDVSEMIAISQETCKCGHLKDNHYYTPGDEYLQCMMQDPDDPCPCKKYEPKEEG